MTRDRDKGRNHGGKTEMSVIYIAGPITGVRHYQRNFRAAEFRLKLAGYTVFNPAKLPKGLPWEVYMPICYAMIDACNCVYFLKNWHNSKGACLEYEHAMNHSMTVNFEEINQ